MIWIIFLSRMDVSTHTLTPESTIPGIRRLIAVSTSRRGHSTFSALPPGRNIQG